MLDSNFKYKPSIFIGGLFVSATIFSLLTINTD